MDFELTEAQEELCSSVRAVLARRCSPRLARAFLEGEPAPEEPWRSAIELGWPAIAIPEHAGGLGLGFIELGLIIEEHGRALAPGPLLATTTQFAPLLLEAGSVEQQDTFLGPIAAGQLTGALAIAGPATSGLVPDGSLRATPDPSGGWRLTGTRHFVIDGATADEIALVARVEEGDGIGLFVVPRSALRCQPIEALDASRPLATIACENLLIGPERTLGRPGNSAEALDRALDQAVVALALDIVGTCAAMLDLTLEHARQRHQFGHPIGSFQAVQHKCADMIVAIEKARATTAFAMLTIAEDDPRRRIAASVAKACAGDCQSLVGKECIQIHGGMGFTWESNVHLFVKRARSAGQLLGGAAEHRARIATLLEIGGTAASGVAAHNGSGDTPKKEGDTHGA